MALFDRWTVRSTFLQFGNAMKSVRVGSPVRSSAHLRVATGLLPPSPGRQDDIGQSCSLGAIYYHVAQVSSDGSLALLPC